MIIKEYQEFKPVQRALGLKADGMPGPKTLAAVALKLRCHEIWSAVQAIRGQDFRQGRLNVLGDCLMHADRFHGPSLII